MCAGATGDCNQERSRRLVAPATTTPPQSNTIASARTTITLREDPSREYDERSAESELAAFWKTRRERLTKPSLGDLKRIRESFY